MTDDALDKVRLKNDDAGAVAMREYMYTRKLSLLDNYLLPGKKPTIFHIREVRRATWSRFVGGAATELEELERCFRAGVEKIENLEQRDGTYISEFVPPPTEPGSTVMSEESLDRLSRYDIEEIGEVIKQHSGFRMSIERCFLPRRTLRQRYDDHLLHHVAASPSLPASGSETALSPAAPPSSDAKPTESGTGAIGGSSANPTDATAAASTP